MMKRVKAAYILFLLALLALCLLPAVSCAETKTAGGFTFDIRDDGTAIVTGYSGTLGNTKDVELVIPADVEGYPVTEIGDMVFQLRRELKSVVIPEGVVSIGEKAFSSCDGIVQITLCRHPSAPSACGPFPTARASGRWNCRKSWRASGRTPSPCATT